MWFRSTTLFSLLGAAALLLGSLPLAPPAYAATFRVTRTDDPPPDGCQPNDCSLREAVIAANAAPGADTIIVPIGTYNRTIAGRGEDAAAIGDLDLTGTVTINGAGRDRTIVNANDLDRVFDVLDGANATIQNLTVQHGVGATAVGEPAEAGGCIRVAAGGTLTFSNAIAESCATVGGGNGGGIQVSGAATISNSIIRDNRIEGNTAGGDGGGIYTEGGSTLNVDNTTIDSNQADNDGGGIETNGPATIRDSRITNNTANSGGEGGGLEVDGPGNVTLENVLVSGNTATGDVGGGIDVDDAAADVTLRNVTVRNNTGTQGGGIHVDLGTLTFSGGTLGPNNTATGDGGGLEVDDGTTATLSNVRIFDNTAGGEGGGIDNDGTLRLDNVRITGNTAGLGTGGGLDYTDDESTSSANTTIVNNNPGNCDPASPCPP